MKCSVVITLFNGESWIRETLASVCAQTRAPDEIVVVDDGSSDGGPDIVRAEPRVRLLRNPDKGVAAARRHGIASTSAPLLAVLDQDDVWHPAHLERLHALLAADPRAGAAASLVQAFTGSLAWREMGSHRSLRMDLWKYFPFHNVVTPSSVLFRRESLEQCGGWPADEDVGPIDDYVALLRAVADGFLIFSGTLTTGYRQHPATQSFDRRLRDPVADLGARRVRLQRTLPLRLRYRPQEESDLNDRLRLLDLMAALYQAILEEDREMLAHAAAKLEAGTDRGLELFRWMAYKFLGWFMRPRLRSLNDEERARLEAWLSTCWPEDAPELRAEVLAAIGPQNAPGGTASRASTV